MKTIHVACGIIRRECDDQILAARRGYGAMEGLWEFPGGKVERGETSEAALERELKEELGVRVSNVCDFYTVEFPYDDFHLSMECFFCTLAEGEEPQANDRQKELRWVPRKTLATLEWMPADADLVRELVALKEDETGTKRKKKSKLLRNVRTGDLTGDEQELVRRRAAIKKSMRGNKRSNTKPEQLVRERLRAAGLAGYRLQWKKAPGRPDIAYPGRKVAIFVNGCFWHRCPHCNPSMPKRNVKFWEAKFTRNMARDQKALAELAEMGWCALTVWECELKRDRIDATMERVIDAVRAAKRD